ncbi:protein of unknown function [Pseudobutyrivibrio sp. C4]|uniref:DUF4422 domain-containing protein n=1 Tax=Pseudobutyrivibrio sp. C4 TaxID=1520803 RepID=UPI0008D70CE3|nr:DUF4422 domain-containing protein [Pseudobutyrivibrio sp. C4]SET12541.1 protein of unknown function [Pseudobutyrivibrio sp. C4]
MYYANEIVDRIKKSNDVYIYGAGIVADEVASCIMDKPYNIIPKAFIVTDMKNNPETFHGKKVITFEEFSNSENKDVLILVACLEKVKREIFKTLEENGFKNIISLSFESDEWSNVRANYIMHYFHQRGLEYRNLHEELKKVNDKGQGGEIEIYRAISAMDKNLKEDISRFNWEKKIQVGAALSDSQVSNIRDNTGENISGKNRMYCELTALYWMWKNTSAEYLGLCHYRRHFVLTEEERRKLPQSDIDVVLTVPIANFPDVRTIYARDHIIEDWEILKKAIKEKYPDYYEDVEKLEKGNVYFAYNMFIARREIFNKYCEFLFDVLDYCESHCVVKNDQYQNRYLGFLGERLLSIFMFHHYDEYKIAVADKHFAE